MNGPNTRGARVGMRRVQGKESSESKKRFRSSRDTEEIGSLSEAPRLPQPALSTLREAEQFVPSPAINRRVRGAPNSPTGLQERWRTTEEGRQRPKDAHYVRITVEHGRLTLQVSAISYWSWRSTGRRASSSHLALLSCGQIAIKFA